MQFSNTAKAAAAAAAADVGASGEIEDPQKSARK
jgi:hypothetical protein